MLSLTLKFKTVSEAFNSYFSSLFSTNQATVMITLTLLVGVNKTRRLIFFFNLRPLIVEFNFRICMQSIYSPFAFSGQQPLSPVSAPILTPVQKSAGHFHINVSEAMPLLDKNSQAEVVAYLFKVESHEGRDVAYYWQVSITAVCRLLQSIPFPMSLHAHQQTFEFSS